ncbi:ABC transporter permease family protein [Neorhizobium alkalisoli]|uniref:hypothetical protein n=1 Tax=Neorhizobium alkalisoli TaxID=528178 RepID=UPI000CF98BD0|nr:hypothetical protein [Neorhizobium alkalisoli]
MILNRFRHDGCFFLVTLGLLHFSFGGEIAHSEGAVAPIIEREALASTKNESIGVLICGIETEYFSRLKVLSGSVANNAAIEFKNGSGVMISAKLAQQLSLHPNEVITLFNPVGQITVMGAAPRVTRYHILAIVDDEAFAGDRGAVYIQQAEAEKFSKSGQ